MTEAALVGGLFHIARHLSIERLGHVRSVTVLVRGIAWMIGTSPTRTHVAVAAISKCNGEMVLDAALSTLRGSATFPR